MSGTRKRGQQGGALQVILAIVGALVVLALVAVVAALWAVRTFVKVETTRTETGKNVAIRTPIGDIELEKAEGVADRLRLPIYPGATADEEDSGAVRLRGWLGREEGGLDAAVAHFRTHDDFDKVDAWYQQQLGPDYVRKEGRVEGAHIQLGDKEWEVEVGPDGEDVAFLRERPGLMRGVVLRHKRGYVQISLFDVSDARAR